MAIMGKNHETPQLAVGRNGELGFGGAQYIFWLFPWKKPAAICGVLHFQRQQIIDRFIVDFYCHKAALVVEVDGGIHLEQYAYDRERELFLKDIGLRVLRFTNMDVEHNLVDVLHAILQACQQHQEEGKSES
jgi:very-short-patch-repair endonuclease